MGTDGAVIDANEECDVSSLFSIKQKFGPPSVDLAVCALHLRGKKLALATCRCKTDCNGSLLVLVNCASYVELSQVKFEIGFASLSQVLFVNSQLSGPPISQKSPLEKKLVRAKDLILFL